MFGIIIHNGQKVQTVQLMNKPNMVYPCSGIVFSIKKNEVLICATTCMNLKTLLSKRSQTGNYYILYESIYMKFFKRQIH